MKDVPSKSIWGVFHHAKKRMIQSIIFTVIAGLVQLAIPFITKEFTTQHKLIWKQPPHSRSVLPLVWLLLAVAAVFCVRLYFNNKGIFYRRQANVAKAARVLIFEKMFDLNIIHHGHFVDTTMINLVTSDVENIFACVMIIPGFTSAILNLTLQFYFIYPFKIYDLALVAFLLLIVALFRWITAVARRKLAVLQRSNDHITKSLKEFMAAVEYSKTFHLQGVFYRLLMRKKEQQSYISKSYIGWTQAAEVISSIAPNLFGLIYFAIQLLATKPPSSTEDDAGLSLAQTYSILTVLSIMRVPINSIKDTFMLFPNFMVSKRRIEIFLQKTLEKPPNEIQTTDIPLCQIEFDQAEVGFGASLKSQEADRVLERAKGDASPSVLSKKPKKVKLNSNDSSQMNVVLLDINLKIESGRKVAIVGPSSSGKTTLLLSILGETEVRSGSIRANGRTTYLPEEPCLVEDSIFQNVIMGTPFDPDRYQSALRFSKLDSALACIENGDRLVVKDNGSSLSYKIRKLICLARMFYHEYDLYLIDHFFDDISHEYIHYFAEEVMKKHLAHKTILVTTRSLEICNLFDRIIVMDEGRIVQVGEFEELERDRDGMFFTMLHQNANYQKKRDVVKTRHHLGTSMKQPTLEVEAMCVDDKNIAIKYNQKVDDIPTNPLINDEPYPKLKSEKRWGAILGSYFLAQGLTLPVIYFFLLFMTQSSALGFTIFTAIWRSNLITQFRAWEYFLVFVAITSVNIFISLLRRYFRVKYFRRISFSLFGEIAKGLLNQSLTFFKTTSLAAKMATFVAGYDEIDEQAGNATSNVLIALMAMLLGVIAICYKTYITGSLIVIVFLVILWILYSIMKTDSQLKQIIIQNRTFLLNSVIDTYRGLLTFRNSGHREYLLEHSMTLNDIYLNTMYIDTNFQQRWIAARTSSLAMLFPLLVMIDIIINAAINWNADPIINGLKFTIAIDVCIVGSTFVSNFIANETFIAEIMDIIKREPEQRAAEQQLKNQTQNKSSMSSEKSPEKSDPNKLLLNDIAQNGGNLAIANKKAIIELRNFTYFHPFMKYPALIDVSFKIFAGESVGIVGRNGSGKHTILRLLACLSTPKGIAAGTLRILDREVSREEEKDPQDDIMFLSSDYCMFEGTLRSNIDPLGKFTDEVIIQLFDYLGLWELLPKSDDELVKQHTLIDPVNDYEELRKIKEKSAHLSFEFASNISLLKHNKERSIKNVEFDKELDQITMKGDLTKTRKQDIFALYSKKLNKRCLSVQKCQEDANDDIDKHSEQSYEDEGIQKLISMTATKEQKLREMKRYLLQRKTMIVDTQFAEGKKFNNLKRKSQGKRHTLAVGLPVRRQTERELSTIDHIRPSEKRKTTHLDIGHNEIMRGMTTQQIVDLYRDKIMKDHLNEPKIPYKRDLIEKQDKKLWKTTDNEVNDVRASTREKDNMLNFAEKANEQYRHLDIDIANPPVEKPNEQEIVPNLSLWKTKIKSLVKKSEMARANGPVELQIMKNKSSMATPHLLKQLTNNKSVRLGKIPEQKNEHNNEKFKEYHGGRQETEEPLNPEQQEMEEHATIHRIPEIKFLAPMKLDQHHSNKHKQNKNHQKKEKIPEPTLEEHPSQQSNLRHLNTINTNRNVKFNEQDGRSMLVEASMVYSNIDKLKFFRETLPLLYKQKLKEDEDSQLQSSSGESSEIDLIPFIHYSLSKEVLDSPDYHRKLHLLQLQVKFQGRNFNRSQKRMLQIGKAILYRPKILLVDSSFCKVEQSLNVFTQRLLHCNLLRHGSTIVTVEDRLTDESLALYDSLLVMDRGRVVQQGWPQNLVQEREGVLAELIEEEYDAF